MPENTHPRSPAFGNSVSENEPETKEGTPFHALRLVPGGAPGPLPAPPSIPKLQSSKYSNEKPVREKVRQAIVEDDPLTPAEVEKYWDAWLHGNWNKGHSPKTTTYRAELLPRLLWFLETVDYEGKTGLCDVAALREFIGYVRHGHNSPGGRWGNPRLTKPARPLTVHRYWRELKAFYSWVVKEGYLARSPMSRVDEPEKKTEQVPYLREAHLKALFAAALQSKYPRRDTAILAVLLDTGLRASEIVNLTHGDVDLFIGFARVTRKGGKQQEVPLTMETAGLIRAYVRHELGNPKEVDPNVPLFLGERCAGRPMTPAALRFLTKRLARAAGINTRLTKLSPHVFRHTCAIMLLLENASEKMIKELLGHSSLKMTHQYMDVADSDLKRQHSKFSPMATLRKNNVVTPTLRGRPRQK
jgi:integrase/recombinase XerD